MGTKGFGQAKAPALVSRHDAGAAVDVMPGFAKVSAQVLPGRAFVRVLFRGVVRLVVVRSTSVVITLVLSSDF